MKKTGCIDSVHTAIQRTNKLSWHLEIHVPKIFLDIKISDYQKRTEFSH